MYAIARRLIAHGFAALLIGLGAFAWNAYHRAIDPATIRQTIVAILGRAIPKAKISLGHAEGNPFRGIELRDLALRRSVQSGKDADVLRIASATALLDQSRLLAGSIRASRIALDGVDLHVHTFRDGTCNLSEWCTGQALNVPAETLIEIRGSRIRLTFEDPGRAPIELTVPRGSLRLGPPDALAFAADIRMANVPLLKVNVTGTLSGGLAFRVVPQGDLDVPALVGWLPAPQRDRLASITELVGRARGSLSGSVRMTKGKLPVSWRVAGSFDKVGFRHPQLPEPIRDASGQFEASPGRLNVSQLAFDIGPVRGEGSGTFEGQGLEEIAAQGSLVGVPLDDRLFQLLPPKHQQNWDKFQPTGIVNVEGTFRCSKGVWSAAGTAQSNNVAVCYYLFPYKVEHAVGTITLHEDGSLSVDARGRAADSPVGIKGTLSAMRPQSAIDLMLWGQAVPFDDRLIDACPPRTADILTRFKGVGTGDFVASIQRDEGTSACRVGIEVDVSAKSVACDWFPLAVQNVTGHLSIQPGQTRFTRVVGNNGEMAVQIDGVLTHDSTRHHLDLEVRAEKVSLDHELHAALPDSWRPAWSVLRPSGAVDVVCRLAHESNRPVEIALVIDPRRASIVPTVFPYRLSEFDGPIEYRDDAVYWTNLSARHGPVRLRCDGRVTRLSDGVECHFVNLVSDAIPLTGDLRAALPDELAKLVDYLSPSRPVRLAFNELVVRHQTEKSTNPRIQFDGSMRVTDCDLIPSIGARNVSGGISLVGTCDGVARTLRGNLDLPQLTLAGFAAKDVSARVEGNHDRFNLTNLRGQFYDGDLHGEVLIATGDEPAYQCRLTAINARLAQFARQKSKDVPEVDGFVDAEVLLHGRRQTFSQLNGRGRLSIRQADIYQLPIILEVVRLLKFEVPNGRAFEDVDSSFRFEDGSMVFEKLQFTGPALSLFLEDEGRLDLVTRDLDVTLRPRWAKGKLFIPLVTDTFNTLSDQLITIHVGGPLSSPTVMPRPIPGFQRLLLGPVRPTRKR